MTAKLPEEVPLRSSARLHGVKLSQAVFDEDSLRSTPRKTRKVAKTNKPSATPKQAAPEVTGLESPASRQRSVARKESTSSRAHPTTSRSTPKPKAKGEAKPKRAAKRKGDLLSPAVRESSTAEPPPQGETEPLPNVAGTPQKGKKKSVSGGRVRKSISKNTEPAKARRSKRSEIRVVVESRVSRGRRPKPLGTEQESGEQQGKEFPGCDAALPGKKRHSWMPTSQRRKFTLPLRRTRKGNGEETQTRNIGVFERALPMGLMATGVVSTMLLAYFYPAFRELPNRMY